MPPLVEESRNPESDDLLLKRYQRGETGAFDELVRRHYQKSVRIALTYLKDFSLAEDAAQEAFIKIHRYANQFQGQASFTTWLYRIVVNLCIDQLRKRKRSPLEQPNPEGKDDTRIMESDEEGFLPRDTAANPGQHSDRRELRAKISQALEKLPRIHREIIVLRELEGLSYEEIAVVLKIRKGTVMSRLFHARRAMQVELSEYLRSDTINEGG